MDFSPPSGEWSIGEILDHLRLGERVFRTLRAELCTSLQETESLFAANPALDYNAMTYEYPMLGIQTVPQLLDFLGIEESRHQGQIDRVIAAPRFPKTG